MRNMRRTIIFGAVLLTVVLLGGVAIAARSTSDQPKVVVPNVVGMTLIDATRAVTATKLTWKLSSKDAVHREPLQPRVDGGTVSPSADFVLEQSPTPGSGAEIGTTVELKMRCSDVACQ